MHDAGIVDHNVQAAKSVHAGLHCSFPVFGVGHVACYVDCYFVADGVVEGCGDFVAVVWV